MGVGHAGRRNGVLAACALRSSRLDRELDLIEGEAGGAHALAVAGPVAFKCGVDLLGRGAAVAALEVHHQEQLELGVAYGQVVPGVARRPGEQLGELVVSPGVHVYHDPRLVALAKVLGAHRFLKALEDRSGVTPVWMDVLGELHRHRHALEGVHAQVVLLRLPLGAHPAHVAVLAAARLSLQRFLLGSPSHGPPPRAASGCRRSGRPGNCG